MSVRFFVDTHLLCLDQGVGKLPRARPVGRGEDRLCTIIRGDLDNVRGTETSRRRRGTQATGHHAGIEGGQRSWWRQRQRCIASYYPVFTYLMFATRRD